MPLDLKDTSEETKEPRRFRLDLSPAGLVGAIGLLLVGLVWVFIIGVLVGRGYKPEQAVPELARIMPGANATADDQAAARADKGVLRPEDLQFYDDLSKKPVAPKAAASRDKAPAQAAPEPKQTAKPEPAPSPAPRATAKAEPAPGAEPAPSAEQAAKAAPAPSTQDDDGDQTVYDYRYQAASVRDRASAMAFQKRLSALGLESSLEKAEVKGATWLRVIVHFRGRPVDTRGLKTKLATLGVDKPIMRAKEPAGQ